MSHSVGAFGRRCAVAADLRLTSRPLGFSPPFSPTQCGKFANRPDEGLESWDVVAGGTAAAVYTFEQEGTYAYLNHNLIKAFLFDAKYVALPDDIYAAAKSNLENQVTGTHFLDDKGEKRSGGLSEVFKAENLKK